MKIGVRILCGLLLVSGVFGTEVAFAQPCTIDFDASCPDAAAECGASFVGGDGCILVGLLNCYDTGSRTVYR